MSCLEIELQRPLHVGKDHRHLLALTSTAARRVRIFAARCFGVFDGEDIRTRGGTIQSQPNIFGGETYQLLDGGRVESVPNVFGGRDYRYPDGRTVRCSPNIFGGEDCR